MSVDLTTLFTRLGKSVKTVNALLTLQGTTLPGYYSAILDQYETRRDLVPTLESTAVQVATTTQGWISSLKSVCDATLGDLQSTLNASSSAPSVIGPLLVAEMVRQSATVKASVVSAPVVTAGGSNVGNGSLLASKKTVAGIDDERALSENVQFTCSADQFTGGTAAGESFTIVGQPAYPLASSSTRGSGNGPVIQVADANNNKILNGNLETFTVANTPDSWTLGTGAVAGTTILSTATAHRGSTALRFQGDGATASVTVSQTPAAGVLAPSTQYLAACWLRKNGTVTAGSTFTVRITATGMSTVNLFTADPTTLTTSYVLKSAFFSTPANLPADAKMEVVWSSANSAGALAQVLMDDAVIVPGTVFGATTYAMVAGSTPFIKGDSFSVVTANSNAGVIQSFAGRFYNLALPSATGGAETIADSLAT